MVELVKETIPVNIEDEMRQSYLDYAMSVIVGRALPDVRDGLKPVHRRVLFAMSVLNNDWNKAYKKSARIVGDVIGKYHPHGDTAVYDTIVRMAQPFSMRHMLVDGQGNFGSVDGDSAAAMRYTEIRMSKLSHEMLADLDKETVDFNANYDESEHEPTVLPARVPLLLINGSSGIAVGMATNIPPHNLAEITTACLRLIEKPETTIDELMECIPGPDFPTAGIINGASGIREAYHTGRGKIYLRARYHVEGDDGISSKQSIVVTELPYQVNKARLLEKIAHLVKDAKLEGISGLRDESDKDGMRMVIELKRGEVPEVIINNLYQHTQLQNVFGINMVALIDGRPKCLNIKQILNAFIDHRREVVTRRTIFDLRKARERAHNLEGLAVALSNIDEMIAMIKAAKTPAEAKVSLLAASWKPGLVAELLSKADSDRSRPDKLGDEYGFLNGSYHLSPAQAQAILELRLHRLTGLEQDKILQEYKDLLVVIDDLLDILGSRVRLMTVISDELIALIEEYKEDRRTEIVDKFLNLTAEDLITEEDMVVTLSHEGYVKSQPLTSYTAQRRGGKGKTAANTKNEDYIDKLFIANTHDTVLCFSSKGKVYWLRVFNLPVASRIARGKPIVNLLPLDNDERINAILPIREFNEDEFIFMATEAGTVKKTNIKEFEKPRANGKIAIDLRDDDTLVGVVVTNGQKDVMLFASSGKVASFNETGVRAMGRTASGVRGMRLKDKERIISLIISEEGTVLTLTENGYGKRTNIEEYPIHKRGGQGVIAMQTSERNGALVGAILVDDSDELMLITDGGTLVRTRTSEISILGRNTQGVRVIRPSKNEKVIGLDRIASLGDEEMDDDADEGESSDEQTTD
ncbi:MAG TPA: DNA gyrase subunit A [Cycloclasticus sp.]|jgi:DNA gyrase subunit A|nr:DNA gyrase subunit A [Cycloclasticus sp.]HIL91939.1 DNA gyrase subunit A [Cycloclasticus sp.]